MRRVTDVLDCWFESGSMPFAQVHYPFARADWFESHFPADFIVEYVAQTRGWFYTMHVLSTALFDRRPFDHCVAHGIILGDDGRKMSKRLGNYPEPDMVFDTWGADAMRWFLLSSTILRGQDLVVHAKGIEDVRRQVLNRFWNTWYFLSLYANVDDITGRFRTDASGVLDRYILAKTAALIDDVTASMDAYDLYGACTSITTFLDALTNWYVRRSRDRFWRARDGRAEADQDKADAYDTLATVLATLCRLSAPLLPLLTEEIYRGLTGERSVHLTDWPAAAELPADPELVETMDLVRDICSAGHAIRKAKGRRARLPLRTLTVATADPDRLRPFVGLIADEVNVKEVRFAESLEDVAEHVLTLVPSALGPRLGSDTPTVFAAMKKGDWTVSDDGVTAGGLALEPGEYELVLRPRHPDEGRTLPRDVGVVTLDIDVDDELEAEGRGSRRRPADPGRAPGGRAARLGLHHRRTRRPRRRGGRRGGPPGLRGRPDAGRGIAPHRVRHPGHQGHQSSLPARLTGATTAGAAPPTRDQCGWRSVRVEISAGGSCGTRRARPRPRASASFPAAHRATGRPARPRLSGRYRPRRLTADRTSALGVGAGTGG